MKAQVLFDKNGKIIGMLHLPSEPVSGKQPVATLRPQTGQMLATLEIPTEFHHLKPAQLHASLHVEHSQGTPRLAGKMKS
jgi:hypothetical protein